MSRAKTSTRFRLFAPFDALYGSYWIDGLRHLGTIELSPLPAQLMPSSIAFEFEDRKFVIDSWDKEIVNDWWWKWSDTYGKVNLSLDTVLGKVVPMGPSFATRAWGSISMASTFLRTARWSKAMSVRDYAGGFLRQRYKRLPLNELGPGRSDPAYIFALHQYWPTEPAVNELRARFMRLAKASNQAGFEGGFACSSKDSTPEYDDLVYPRLPYRTWLQRTRRSAVVLNTPGVYGCLGWKLGEYLALGKAIISVPIQLRLPGDLEHGTHVHLVDGSEASLRDAMEHILSDDSYRSRLEANARAYFDRYLSPPAAVRRLTSQP